MRALQMGRSARRCSCPPSAPHAAHAEDAVNAAGICRSQRLLKPHDRATGTGIHRAVKNDLSLCYTYLYIICTYILTRMYIQP